MVAPNITIGTPEAYPASIDLTAVSSPNASWNERQGFTGADWVQTVFNGNDRHKKEGASQCSHSPFATGSPLTNTFQFPGITPTFTGGANGDEYQDSSSPYGSAAIEWDIGAAQIDSGVRWSSILAPYGTQKVIRLAINTAAGTYVLKANFADASAFADGNTFRTLTLTNGTMLVYPITFNGPLSSANLIVEVRRTVASGGTGFVATQYAYIAPPTTLSPPSGFRRHILMQRGITGGPLS